MIVEIISEIIADLFIRSWFGSVIRHIGAGLRYGCLRLFQPRRKVSYKRIRYGSDDFNIGNADNDFANGFIGFIVFMVILLIIAK